MENNLDEINNIDDNTFEQINSSLLDLKYNSEDRASIKKLTDQVAQMNRILQEIFNLVSLSSQNQKGTVDTLKEHQDALDTIGRRLVEIYGYSRQANMDVNAIPLPNQDSDRLNEFSTILTAHTTHLGFHDQHLESHNKHLAALTQQLEILNQK